ncbi:MAG TPA: type II toxin-antitoxin system RelE/ParE family toxin [Prolixibacteraceae bacterium]|jgi:plasmid stabilization system protein ParE
MAFDYKIFWADEALNNLEDILEYLSKNWTQREVAVFKKSLSKQITLIEQNPKLFPVSQFNPRLRKSVLSKHTTIFYEVSGSVIYLVYLFGNKQNIKRIE